MTRQETSAIADKPRDTFVQYAVAWLTLRPKTSPSYMCYHADFGQARPDCVAISRGVPKDDALGLRPLGSGRD